MRVTVYFAGEDDGIIPTRRPGRKLMLLSILRELWPSVAGLNLGRASTLMSASLTLRSPKCSAACPVAASGNAALQHQARTNGRNGPTALAAPAFAAGQTNVREGLFASMCLQERAMRLQSDKRLRMTASLGLSSA